MKQFFINNNSDKLILFFTGWGCDEFEFEHLKTSCDVLLFYDYTDLNHNFDFSKYSEINVLSFSAGVFVGSVFKYDFKINKKIALSGNPYLFDENLGLSKEIQKILFSITPETQEEFVKNYLIFSDEEYKNFHPSGRTLESCQTEFEALKEIYQKEKNNIKDDYDYAVIGEYDKIFSPEAQRKYYKTRLKTVRNARHNLFFQIKSYSDILKF
ncbi:DUF452 family protein [bacterium]|nr:DUF452 family protein [bacterium]